MKPREFDDLIRNKFDQNDFAYDPHNWEKLAGKLEGNAKKRRVIVWWWIPMAGVAASLLMAMGVTSMMRQEGSGRISHPAYALHLSTKQHSPVATIQQSINSLPAQHRKNANSTHKNVNPVKDNTDNWFAINIQNTTAAKTTAVDKSVIPFLNQALPEQKKKQLVANEPHPTFKPDAEAKKAPKLSVILSGGVNHGSQSSGYVAGATLRRMVSDKVYVEGDLGFASSTNLQSNDVSVQTGYTYVPVATRVAGKATTSARTTAAQREQSGPTEEPVYTNELQNQSYNVNYLQVSPAIGFKVMKRMSVGVGPDFQQMLSDNRPAAPTNDRNTIQEAPLFDVGFIGKTEYAITKKLKAGLYYRKGVNDIISTNDKYIDRDYVQFQLKCVIFNK